MWRCRAMAMGVCMVVFMAVGMGVNHQNMLYYNITGVHALARPAGPPSRGADRPRLASISPSSRTEGAGKTGCALHPRSRVQDAQKEAHTSIQVQRRQSGLPAQWLYGLLRALPGERAFLPPSLHDVTRETGRQHRGARTTRLRRPRQAALVSRSHRGHRIPPRVRDDREPPLLPGGTDE
jgi:hypothetical protein